MMRDIRAIMGSAIMNAIIDTNRDKTGVALVDTGAAQHALIIAIAMILEADPSVRTTKDIREVGETIGRKVGIQLKALRDEHDRTGRRAWDATPILMQ